MIWPMFYKEILGGWLSPWPPDEHDDDALTIVASIFAGDYANGVYNLEGKVTAVLT